MHSYMPGGLVLASQMKECSPAESAPENSRATSSPRRFTTVTRATPLSGDVKRMVVDWERGLGYAEIEVSAGTGSSTALLASISGIERRQTPPLVPAKRFEPITARAW